MHTLTATAQQPHQGGYAASSCDGCVGGRVVGSQTPQRRGCFFLHTLVAAAQQPHQGPKGAGSCNGYLGLVGSQTPPRSGCLALLLRPTGHQPADVLQNMRSHTHTRQKH